MPDGLPAARRALLCCLILACRTAPHAAAASEPADAGPAPEPSTAQSFQQLPQAGDTAVLALQADLAALPREQRLVAYWAAQAGEAAGGLAWEQAYRHNAAVVRLLRGILSRPQVGSAAVLPRIREFARAVWLQRGLHDAETGRKLTPPFSFSELRLAALAAQAAGADLGLRGASFEYGLRALEAPLFDPAVDALLASRSAKDPVQSSAVNFYDGVSSRELAGFDEHLVRDSQLVKREGRVHEEPYRVGGLYGDRLARAAAALDQALPPATREQRGLLEALGSALREGGAAERAAERALLDAQGPVSFFAGFTDPSADPRGRKALFASWVGMPDTPRTELLAALAAQAEKLALPWRGMPGPPHAEALWLLSSAGSARPLVKTAWTLPLDPADRGVAGARTAFFAGADEALTRFQGAAVQAALAPPGLEEELRRCLPQQRFAFVALRELLGRSAGPQRLHDAALDEARADLAAHFFAQDPLIRSAGLLPDARCAALWPQFAATGWFAASARLPPGERVEDSAQVAVQLQLWWFTGKGALTERREGGRRWLAAADAEHFHAAAAELLGLLEEIDSLGDAARLRDLIVQHGTRIDPGWRDEVLQRLKALNLPRRVLLLPPRLTPILESGKVVDAQAARIDDLDAEILRSWQDF